MRIYRGARLRDMGVRAHAGAWRRGARALALLLAAWSAGAVHPERAAAQGGPPAAAIPGMLTAGGELDNYLRYLSSMGLVPALPWGLRAFSPAEADSLTKITGAHPWKDSWLFRPTAPGKHFWVLPAWASAQYNSSYPFGGNDGPIWAGRGVTVAGGWGVAARWGPLTVVLAPETFVTQNQPFALIPTGQLGPGRFRNADFPNMVDLPQRFGSGAYGRVDPGNSTVRLDFGAMGIGLTTANQWWGPATTYPVILGNNAPGVPHAFLGTNRPVNVFIGRAQVQVLYGIEQQSSFSPATGPATFTDASHPGTLRFMSGLIATFSPGAVPGLEIGGARYFHQAWFGHIGSAELRAPFEGLLKSGLPSDYNLPGVGTQDVLKNQLASIFGRWVLPHSGFELYGEYGREDHAGDLRDLANEPDHSRIAMLGLRKAFVRSGSGRAFSAIRAEVLDGSAPTLGRRHDPAGLRVEGLVYVHYPLVQGHTMDGQLLGANVGVGSPSGAVLAWDRYTDAGRSTWYVAKTTQNNGADFTLTGRPVSLTSDVLGTVGFERVRLGSRTDIRTDIAATYRRGRAAVRGAHGWNIVVAVRAALHLTH